MLPDMKLRGLKPAEKPYKVADRDGMYVTASTAGTVPSATITVSMAGARR